ncbi:MAG: glycoside hydrolase superfamily [Benjaminiella poitrasii]|nr:MAG: glycoside hydrolase superfamily [Benjaminiella poitrasii]
MTHCDIGQLVMFGFDGLVAPEPFLDLIRTHHIGHIILFSRNIDTPQQLFQLTQQLQQTAHAAGHPRPLFIAVDQENGVIRRLGMAGTYLPGNMALGSLRSSSAAYQVATATATELHALGVHWNLAPVLDVNNNPQNPVIGVRSYSEDPQLVSRLGQAQVEGLQRRGVAACVKHFPGHGDTATDSHLGVPVIDKSVEQLEALEWVPFREVLAARGRARPASVMVGHVVVPQLGPDPASIDPSAVRVLRETLGFDGVIVTDCLEMDAIKDTIGVAQGALRAFHAGNDVVIVSHTLAFQQETLRLLSEQTDASIGRDLERSLQRVADMKDRYLSWDQVLAAPTHSLDLVGSFGKLSDRLYAQVPSIVCDRHQTLPLRLSETDKIVFLAAHVPLTQAIDSESEPFNSMFDAIRRRHSNTDYTVFHPHERQPNATLLRQVEEARLVIVGTANANLHAFQADMVRSLAAACGDRLVVIAVINPYDLLAFQKEVSTYLVTFEYTPPAHEAAIRLVFGETKPYRKPLPITITVDQSDVRVPEVQTVECTDASLRAAHALWMDVFGESWALSYDNFCCVVRGFQQGRHLAVYDNSGKMVGFAATQQLVEGDGQLALLMVHPNHRCQGLGTQLNDVCLELFRKSGCSRVMLGATYPRFFCGVPDDRFIDFFEHRGYHVNKDLVWDLMGTDIEHYEVPQEIEQRMQNVTFETFKDARQVEELLAFEREHFECWVSTYENHARLGDYRDFLVARIDGRIVGSLVLYTTGQSHASRTDLIWTEQLGVESGGMACVGVSSEQRGKGIGLGLVAYANRELRRRGVKRALVDWVELVGFYGRTGYQKWRSYRLAEMN